MVTHQESQFENNGVFLAMSHGMWDLSSPTRD